VRWRLCAVDHLRAALAPRPSPATTAYGVGVTSKADQYHRFWTRYLERVAARHADWAGIGTATVQNYLYQRCPIRDCRFAPGFKGDGRIGHELVIQSPDQARNTDIFEMILERRGRFEDAYGRALTWDPVRGAKRYLVGEYRHGSIDREQDHDDYIVWFIDCGERLRRALGTLPADL
jgi:hypothetical protein